MASETTTAARAYARPPPVMRFFATCPPGLEPALARELAAECVGASNVKLARAGVSFESPRRNSNDEHPLATAYRAVLWSRTAVRVLNLLHDGPLVVPTRRGGPDAAYATAIEVPWEKYVGRGLSVDVRARVAKDAVDQGIDSSRFCALRTRDAVCDVVREATGERPPPPSRPDGGADVPLFIAVKHGRAQIYRDLVGNIPLNRRGYKGAGGAVATHEGTLNEGCAAGALMLAELDEMLEAGNMRAVTMADPMCGAGTLAIEAALIACRIAPGLLRILHADKRFSLSHATSDDAVRDLESTLPIRNWPDHSRELFARVVADAVEAARPAPYCGDVRICCNDLDASALETTRRVARIAEVSDVLEFADMPSRARSWAPRRQADFVVVNPPWGKRVGLSLEAMAAQSRQGEEEEMAQIAEEEAWDDLRYFLRDSGAVIPGGDAWVLSGDPSLTASLRMKASRKIPISVAGVDSRFLRYKLRPPRR